MPWSWPRGVIINLHKKGSKPDVGNIIGKFYNKVLNNRIMKCLEGQHILHESQNGFRQHRSTADHIISLSEILKETRNHQRTYLLKEISSWTLKKNTTQFGGKDFYIVCGI